MLVLVGNGQYGSALAGVQHALTAYQGPAKLQVGQAQNSSNSSSSQMTVDVRAGDQETLQVANDRVVAALSKVQGLAEIKTNLVSSKPQYQLVPTDRLAASGLNVQTLAALYLPTLNADIIDGGVIKGDTGYILKTGGLMLFCQYQGPTTQGRPIYDGRFNMKARKPVSEERVDA